MAARKILLVDDSETMLQMEQLILANERLEDVDEPTAHGGGDADPLARAVARQQSGRLAEAVAGLGPLDREVLSLRFEEDLALPQLAETLQVRVPTAKARLYPALARLRERLLVRGPAEDWR